MLRRDRIRLPAWTLGLTLLMTYFATALNSMVRSPADLEGLTAFTGSPAGALFGGRGFGFDDLTVERFLAGQYGLYVAIGAGLMGLLTVVRHTRAEERSGRAELVRANAVGRHAQLTAALDPHRRDVSARRAADRRDDGRLAATTPQGRCCSARRSARWRWPSPASPR